MSFQNAQELRGHLHIERIENDNDKSRAKSKNMPQGFKGKYSCNRALEYEKPSDCRVEHEGRLLVHGNLLETTLMPVN